MEDNTTAEAGGFTIGDIGIELPDEIEFDGNWLEQNEQSRPLCKKLENVHFMRKLTSEKQIEMFAELELQRGGSYHLLTQGKINSFTFLEYLLKQQSLKRLIISTWAVSMSDVEKLEQFVDSGRIGCVDFCLGDIFLKARREQYEALAELARKRGGRAIILKTHSKVMVGFGEKYDFVLESSANIHAKMRAENTCLTLSTELAQIYREWFCSRKSLLDDWIEL